MNDTEVSKFIDDEVKGYLALVEAEILGHLEGDTRLEDIASYLLKAGGKRVRPALLIVAYKACGGGDLNRVVPISAAIELIHTASLIHDDINDGAAFRRGIQSTNRRYGELPALVAGDFLFVEAFRISGMYEDAVIEMIADSCRSLAEGEILQNENRYNVEMDVDTYRDIIRRKTASLIRASLKVGAYLGEASPDQLEALEMFGNCIGLVFQITDDILDVKGDEEKTGKPRGTDIMEGQMTILAIRALDKLEGRDHDELARIITKRDHTSEDVDRAIELISSTDAVDHAYEIAREHADECIELLEALDDSEYRDRLELAVETIFQRAY